jgi:hypothetical protein
VCFSTDLGLLFLFLLIDGLVKMGQSIGSPAHYSVVGYCYRSSISRVGCSTLLSLVKLRVVKVCFDIFFFTNQSSYINQQNEELQSSEFPPLLPQLLCYYSPLPGHKNAIHHFPAYSTPAEPGCALPH